MIKETILITGGAGFIGLNLTDYILKNNKYKIIILDNLSSGNINLLKEIIKKYNTKFTEGFTSNSDFSFIKADIRDKDLGYVFKESDYVVHLAAQTGVIPSIENPFEDGETNVMGTLNLLNLSVKNNIKKFILASSAAPLGEHIPPLDATKIP